MLRRSRSQDLLQLLQERLDHRRHFRWLRERRLLLLMLRWLLLLLLKVLLLMLSLLSLLEPRRHLLLRLLRRGSCRRRVGLQGDVPTRRQRGRSRSIRRYTHADVVSDERHPLTRRLLLLRSLLLLRLLRLSSTLLLMRLSLTLLLMTLTGFVLVRT